MWSAGGRLARANPAWAKRTCPRLAIIPGWGGLRRPVPCLEASSRPAPDTRRLGGVERPGGRASLHTRPPMTANDAPDAAITSRRYQGLADLPPLLAFASRMTAERSPLPSSWHPGDIIWALQTRADQPQPCRFWTGPEGVEALAWFESDGEVWIETL